MPRTTIISKETRSLPCPLTESERAEFGTALANVLKVLYDARDDEALRRKEVKTEIEAIEARVRALGRVVASGQEYRDVEVQKIADHGPCTVSTVRMDTGEVLSVRDMLPNERQLSVLDPPEEAVPAAE